MPTYVPYDPENAQTAVSTSSVASPDLLSRLNAAVMQAESAGQRYGSNGQLLRSPKGALGEMQVLPSTAFNPGFGVKPAESTHPDELARVGRDYLSALHTKYEGDVEKTLAAYNWGPGNLDQAIDKTANWQSLLPTETQRYVRQVQGLLGQPTQASTIAPPSGKYVPYSGEPAPQASLPAKRSASEELLRQLGLFARSAYQGATGSAQVLSDPLVMGANKLLGTNLPLPSQATEQTLNRFLPQPENPLEKGVGVATQIVGGALDPLLLGAQAKAVQLAPKGFVPQKTGAKVDVIKDLREAGYKIPPSEMEAGTIARTAEGVGGTTRTSQLAEHYNQTVSQRLAVKELNLPENTKLTQDVLRSQANELYTSGYRPIEELPKISIGSKYRSDLQALAAQYGSNKSFPAPNNKVTEVIDSYLYDASGRLRSSFTGKDAVERIKLLRSEAAANFRKDEGLLATVQRGIADAIENNIELNLKKVPAYASKSNLMQNFKDARVALAKNNAVESMLVDADSGVISTPKAAALLRQGTKLTGDLRTIAKAGSPLFSRSTGPGVGNPSPVNIYDSFLYGAGVGGAPLSGGMSLPLAAWPAGRSALRYGVLSEPAQNAMAARLLNQGSIFGAAGPRMQAGAVPALAPWMTPLFLQGEQ